jgi:hypothetical protein
MRAEEPMDKIQYTIRNIPPQVDRALRRKAHEQKTSLNHVLLAALSHAAGSGEGADVLHHDLDHLAGKWVEDPECDAALGAQDQIDPELWR